MFFLSHHDGNVTTTRPVNTGARLIFSLAFSLAGVALVRYGWNATPHNGGVVLIGLLMVALAVIVTGAAGLLVRRMHRSGQPQANRSRLEWLFAFALLLVGAF